MRSRPPVIFVALVMLLAASSSSRTPGSPLTGASSASAYVTAPVLPAAAEPPRLAPGAEHAAQTGAPVAAALDARGAAPAARVAVAVQVAPDPFVPLIPLGLPCAQWLDVALDVGWPIEQIRTVAYVIERESKCRPDAVGVLVCNAHGCARALGLMQLLGWTCEPAGCLDARSNLARAVELWRSSGWRPWCLPGDPVTGAC